MEKCLRFFIALLIVWSQFAPLEAQGVEGGVKLNTLWQKTQLLACGSCELGGLHFNTTLNIKQDAGRLNCLHLASGAQRSFAAFLGEPTAADGYLLADGGSSKPVLGGGRQQLLAAICQPLLDAGLQATCEGDDLTVVNPLAWPVILLIDGQKNCLRIEIWQ